MIVPRPRWFRFSLQTMFLTLTVVCCWLGYYLEWIRERHDYLNQLSPSGSQRQNSDSRYLFERPDVPASHSMPIGLRLLGEPAIAVLRDRDAQEEHEANAVQRLFPEALVMWKRCDAGGQIHFEAVGIPLEADGIPQWRLRNEH